MRHFCKVLLLTAIGLALTGCFATNTSGPLVPGQVLSKLIGKNVLMDDPTVLVLYATNDCNVAAAQEYRLSTLLCTGQLSSVTPGFIVPANLQSIVASGCFTMGYTNGQNQLNSNITPVTVGPASACLAPPAAIDAPIGTKLSLVMPKS